MKTAAPLFKPSLAAPAQPGKSSLGLDSINIDNDFTPSTPYVHKFRTEMCKNWDLYGKCKYGDEVSIPFEFKPATFYLYLKYKWNQHQVIPTYPTKPKWDEWGALAVDIKA